MQSAVCVAGASLQLHDKPRAQTTVLNHTVPYLALNMRFGADPLQVLRVPALAADVTSAVLLAPAASDDCPLQQQQQQHRH
jgi:hypothetical protein